MILIIGGVYQGKLDYALQRFKLAEGDVYRCGEDEIAPPANRRIIYEIDRWILSLVKADSSVPEALERFIEANSDAVVICNDLSCGLVPIDALERRWLEAQGRALAKLAKASGEVIRLFCGIPSRLK